MSIDPKKVETLLHQLAEPYKVSANELARYIEVARGVIPYKIINITTKNCDIPDPLLLDYIGFDMAVLHPDVNRPFFIDITTGKKRTLANKKLKLRRDLRPFLMYTDAVGVILSVRSMNIPRTIISYIASTYVNLKRPSLIMVTIEEDGTCHTTAL